MGNLADAMTLPNINVNANPPFVQRRVARIKVLISIGQEVVAADVMGWRLVRIAPRSPLIWLALSMHTLMQRRSEGLPPLPMLSMPLSVTSAVPDCWVGEDSAVN